MRIKFYFFVSLCLLSVAGVSFSSHATQEIVFQPVATDDQKAQCVVNAFIEEQIRLEEESDGALPEQLQAQYREAAQIAWVDLNGDEFEDAFLKIEHRFWCGSAGCHTELMYYDVSLTSESECAYRSVFQMNTGGKMFLLDPEEPRAFKDIQLTQEEMDIQLAPILSWSEEHEAYECANCDEIKELLDQQ